MGSTAVKEKEDVLVEEQSTTVPEVEVEVVNAKSKFKIYYIFKRLVDFIASLLGLIILSPVFLIVALLIRRDGGKAFFTQSRIGKNGKVIKVYKFRSMVMHGEEVLEKLLASDENIRKEYLTNKKLENDPRITKIGKFIRKTSIDELPQLINVLLGQMSLVGPRPSLPKEVEKFETWMLERLNVKPGLTCYWQVSGRNDIDFEDWMKLDIKYVNERNLWIDIKLIFKTVFVLFGDKHAS